VRRPGAGAPRRRPWSRSAAERMLATTTSPYHAVARSESSMTEFVTLVALGVLVVGLGVLAVACLLTAAGWLVVREVRRSGPARLGMRDGEHRPPLGE
jgi:hypothetical protein